MCNMDVGHLCPRTGCLPPCHWLQWGRRARWSRGGYCSYCGYRSGRPLRESVCRCCGCCCFAVEGRAGVHGAHLGHPAAAVKKTHTQEWGHKNRGINPRPAHVRRHVRLTTHNNCVVLFCGVLNGDALDLLIQALYTVAESRSWWLWNGDGNQNGFGHRRLQEKNR